MLAALHDLQYHFSFYPLVLLSPPTNMGFIERNKAALNDKVAASFVGRFFHLDGSGHVFRPTA